MTSAHGWNVRAAVCTRRELGGRGGSLAVDLTWAPLTLNEFFSAVSDSRTRRGRVGVERRRGGRVARFRLSGRYQGHAEMQHLETVVQGAFSYLVSSVCCLSSSPPPPTPISLPFSLVAAGQLFFSSGWVDGGRYPFTSLVYHHQHPTPPICVDKSAGDWFSLCTSEFVGNDEMLGCVSAGVNDSGHSCSLLPFPASTA